MTTTTFIGAGKIAQAIMGGYLASQANTEPRDKLIASDPMLGQLAQLPSEIIRSQNNIDAIRDANIVVLCVKPNMMQRICEPLNGQTQAKLFISVAAGITIDSLSSWLGQSTSIIRCMPNTPALVQQGMTGLCANQNVTNSQRDAANRILQSVGLCEWFEDESALDAVTAVSGSGPAYYFLVMEAMQKAAISLGLTPEVSRKLVLQTALGAAQMASTSELDAEQLRINVTSPGGTTEAALSSLQGAGIEKTFAEAISLAYERSKALSAD